MPTSLKTDKSSTFTASFGLAYASQKPVLCYLIRIAIIWISRRLFHRDDFEDRKANSNMNHDIAVMYPFDPKGPWPNLSGLNHANNPVIYISPSDTL